MPGTSPVSGWRIPLDSDPLGDIGAAVRNLVDDIEAGWVAYTPTLTNITIGNGTVVARYKRIGKTVHVRVRIVGGTTTTSAANISVSLPFTARTGTNDAYQWIPGILSGGMGGGLVNAGTNRADVLTSSGAWLGTFGNGSSIILQGTYEIA